MDAFRYVEGVVPQKLQRDTCTIGAMRDAAGPWLCLWFCLQRSDTGGLALAHVAINPGGRQHNRARATWGMRRSAEGTWDLSPQVLYRTPQGIVWQGELRLVGVPEPPPWDRN